MSTKIDRKKSKFARYTKGPIKILTRIRDFYVQSLTGCAGQVSYGGDAFGFPAAHNFSNLPRSLSASSSYSNSGTRDEDLKELVRIASTRSLTGKIEAELLRSPVRGGGVTAIRRSRTVTIGRIDEEKPCEFGGVDGGCGARAEVFPRSRSYAA
ncbi:hypothetical protein ACP275_12G022200 [Erythranthe tilingii]